MNDDTNILGTTGRQTPICSICKIGLHPHEEDPNKLQCPRCLREYLPAAEVTQYDDAMESIHEDENVELEGIGSGTSLLVEPDDDIMRPNYKRDPRIVLKEGEVLRDFEGEVPQE